MEVQSLPMTDTSEMCGNPEGPQKHEEPKEPQKNHVCEYAGCGATFQRPGRLKIHYRTHTEERLFVCDRPGCDKSYLWLKSLRRHLAFSHPTRHSPSRESFNSEMCKQPEGPQKDEEPKKPQNNHVCEYAGCGAIFQRPGRLKIHYRTHTGERPFVCDRPGCDNSYSRRQHLRRHLAFSHPTRHSPSRESFKCPVEGCGKYLSSLDIYKKHSRSHQRRQYVCGHCGRAFIKRQHLRIHEHEHTGVKPFRCSREGCEREFLLPSKLRAHELQHDKYRCPVESCGQQLANWNQLLKHRRQLHPVKRAHTCSECDHKFLSKYALRIHKRVHGETREIFHCPYEDCPRYYYFKRNLNSHVRSSHEGRGFVCPVETCKRKLSCKKKLDDHARLHGPNPPLRCPRRKQRVRCDKGVKRGPYSSAFTHVTGEPEPSDAETAEPLPAVDIDPAEVERLAEEAERLAWQCDAPSRKKPRMAQLEPPPPLGWAQLVRSSSEAESGDESAQLLLG